MSGLFSLSQHVEILALRLDSLPSETTTEKTLRNPGASCGLVRTLRRYSGLSKLSDYERRCQHEDDPRQGEFVLAKKFILITDLPRVLDIPPRMRYNRFRLHDARTIGFESRRTPSAPG